MLYTSLQLSGTPPDKKTLIQLGFLIHFLGLIQACCRGTEESESAAARGPLPGVEAADSVEPLEPSTNADPFQLPVPKLSGCAMSFRGYDSRTRF